MTVDSADLFKIDRIERTDLGEVAMRLKLDFEAYATTVDDDNTDAVDERAAGVTLHGQR